MPEHEHTRNWNQVHLLGKMATILVTGKKKPQAAVHLTAAVDKQLALHIRCMIRPGNIRSGPISGGHTVRILLEGFRTVAFDLISKPPPSTSRPPPAVRHSVFD